ncbi:MAG: transglycosylase domain-containing protein [Vicinamibacterales bacterium]
MARSASGLGRRRWIDHHTAGGEAPAGASARATRPDAGRRRGATPGRLARLARKIDEAVLALRLEHRSSKDEILARYLSLAPAWQSDRGCRARQPRLLRASGVEALTTAEAAPLASLPQRPSVLNPRTGRLDAALRRQRKVLARLESLD